MMKLPRLSPGILPGIVLVIGLVAYADEPADVVARFGKEEILRAEVETQAQRMGLAGAGNDTQRQRVRATALEHVVDERAVRAELIRLKLGVEIAAVDAAVDRLEQQIKAQGKDFKTFLAESGRTLESFREQVALELTVQAFVRPRLTRDALARVFEENRREFDGTKLRVSHVLFRPDGGGGEEVVARIMKQADAIRQDVVQGRLTFAEAAARWSVAPSRRSGGDVGWIVRDSPMVEPFSSVAFKLPKGGVSEPFITPFGIHIVTVTAVEPGRLGALAVQGRLERMLAAELVRGLVVEGRRRVGVTFLPGTPHLDPSTLGESNERRPVVIGQQPE